MAHYSDGRFVVRPGWPTIPSPGITKLRSIIRGGGVYRPTSVDLPSPNSHILCRPGVSCACQPPSRVLNSRPSLPCFFPPVAGERLRCMRCALCSMPPPSLRRCQPPNNRALGLVTKGGGVCLCGPILYIPCVLGCANWHDSVCHSRNVKCVNVSMSGCVRVFSGTATVRHFPRSHLDRRDPDAGSLGDGSPRPATATAPGVQVPSRRLPPFDPSQGPPTMQAPRQGDGGLGLASLGPFVSGWSLLFFLPRGRAPPLWGSNRDRTSRKSARKSPSASQGGIVGSRTVTHFEKVDTQKAHFQSSAIPRPRLCVRKSRTPPPGGSVRPSAQAGSGAVPALRSALEAIDRADEVLRAELDARQAPPPPGMVGGGACPDQGVTSPGTLPRIWS